MKDRFTYKKVWSDALQALSEQVREEVNDAIIAYGVSGKLIPLTSAAKTVFTLIKADMDRDNERRAKRRAAAVRRKERLDANAKNKEQETENEKEKFPHTPYKEKDKEKEEEPLSPDVRARENENGEAKAAASKHERFAPTAVEKVLRRGNERNDGIVPGCFAGFYTANGWVQHRGKSP